MGRKSVIALVALIVFIAVFGVLLVIKAVQNNSNKNAATKAKATSTATASNLTAVNSIVSEPLVYKDLTVNVESQIISWTTKNAFTISSGSSSILNTSTARLLAIREKPFPQYATTPQIQLGKQSKVSIKGTVRILDKNSLEVLIGYDFDSPEFALSNSGLQNWTLGPVLIINTVEEVL